MEFIPHNNNQPSLTGNRFCGDILLAGLSENDLWPNIGNILYDVSETSCWHLLINTPSSTWNGYPVFSFLNGPWHVWILGDMYGLKGENDVSEFIISVLSGKVIPSKLNGHFLIWAWNKEFRKWHIYTSRFGTLHAYFCNGRERNAIGTYFPNVACTASGKTLDWEGLTSLFYSGFFMGDKTWFNDIKILVPASHYVFDEYLYQISCKRYWNWEGVGESSAPYSEWQEEFAYLLETVLQEQTSTGRIAIPISGGLDSRSTIAALGPRKPRQTKLWTYSYGYQSNSVETEIAGKVAAAYGYSVLKHTVTPYLFKKLDLILSSVEGFQELSISRQASFFEELRQKSDYIIAAHWGDVWCDSMHVPKNAEKWDEPEIVEFALNKTAKGGRAWLLKEICLRNGISNPKALMMQQTALALENVSHICCPDYRIKAFKTDNWSFRWTSSSLRMFQAAAFPKLPFYDTRISDCLSKIPYRFHENRLFQINYLKRFAPRLAEIKWQSYDANLYRYKYFNSLLLPHRAIAKIKRIISPVPSIKLNWEIQLYGSMAGADINQRLLEEGLSIHNFVPRHEIEALITRFHQTPFEDKSAETLLMLLTFSAWMEFLKKCTPGCHR